MSRNEVKPRYYVGRYVYLRRSIDHGGYHALRDAVREAQRVDQQELRGGDDGIAFVWDSIKNKELKVGNGAMRDSDANEWGALLPPDHAYTTTDGNWRHCQSEK